MGSEKEVQDKTEARIDASLVLELNQMERQVAKEGESLAAASKSLRYALKPEQQRMLSGRIEQHAAMKARIEALRARLIRLQESERRAAAEKKFAELADTQPQ